MAIVRPLAVRLLSLGWHASIAPATLLMLPFMCLSCVASLSRLIECVGSLPFYRLKHSFRLNSITSMAAEVVDVTILRLLAEEVDGSSRRGKTCQSYFTVSHIISIGEADYNPRISFKIEGATIPSVDIRYVLVTHKHALWSTR